MTTTNIGFIIARVFLGGIMLTGGIMHFTIDPVTAYRDDFLNAINATGYLWQMIGAVEIICAIAILTRRYMPLALIVLAPITTIIFTLHLSQVGKVVYKPGGIYIAVPLLLAHLALGWFCRAHYRALFTPQLEKAGPVGR
jgi:putative oxidoreductase